MKILLILTLSLFSGAQASSLCHPEMTLSELRALVEEVRDTHFPELENHDLPFQEYNSDSYYFQASIHISKLLRGRKKFCLDVNEELLACPPSTGALLAIITHELSHFQDYHRLPILGVAGLGVKYGLSKKYRRRYERLTDLKAVHLGHGRGD